MIRGSYLTHPMPGTIRSLRCCLPLRKRSSWGHRRAAHWGHCQPCPCARWWTPQRQAVRHCRLQLQTKSVDIIRKIGGYYQIFSNGGYFQIFSNGGYFQIFQQNWWIFSDIFQWWIFSDISAKLEDIFKIGGYFQQIGGYFQIFSNGGYFQIFQQNWWIFSKLVDIFSKLVDIFSKLVDIFSKLVDIFRYFPIVDIFRYFSKIGGYYQQNWWIFFQVWVKYLDKPQLQTTTK